MTAPSEYSGNYLATTPGADWYIEGRRYREVSRTETDNGFTVTLVVDHCPQCGSDDPDLVGVEKATRRQCQDPYHCPAPTAHGNPFRYCPYCEWREATPTQPSTSE